LNSLRKAPLFLAALLVAGCSSVETHVDYDRAANFSSYRTFAFKDVRTPDNPISLKRVRAAVSRTLGSRGLAESAGEKPDLWVVLHTRAHRQTQVTTYNPGWGWGWGWRGAYWNAAYVRQIPIGTLMVDLVDTKAKELVWRGSASRVVDADESPQTRDEKVQQAVDKLFDGFPPRP
jgi:Domain of unknown function (DUF4136)